MPLNRNKNLKVVGFFGQSGSGKTTIIRNVSKKINGNVVYQNTGIIRYLFGKGNYTNPKLLIDRNTVRISKIEDKKEKNKEIDKIYEEYIRSQFQLLNDWSTEIYTATTEQYSSPSILLVDRSPIDFYALTLCGMKELKEAFGKKLNDMCELLLRLVKKTAEFNTNNFINAIFVTKPWKTSDINNLKDGVRDQYLLDTYTGDNWYPKYNDINLDETKTFTIDENVTDLQERAELVNKCLEEI